MPCAAGRVICADTLPQAELMQQKVKIPLKPWEQQRAAGLDAGASSWTQVGHGLDVCNGS